MTELNCQSADIYRNSHGIRNTWRSTHTFKKLWRFLNQVICFLFVFHWYKYYHHIWTSNKKIQHADRKFKLSKSPHMHENARASIRLRCKMCTRNSFINNSIAQLLFGPLGANCDIRTQYIVEFIKNASFDLLFCQNTLSWINQRSGCFHWKFSISPRKCHWWLSSLAYSHVI